MLLATAEAGCSTESFQETCDWVFSSVLCVSQADGYTGNATCSMGGYICKQLNRRVYSALMIEDSKHGADRKHH